VVFFVAGVALLFQATGMMALIGVLEIVSLVSNVLSYARLMALGLASVALADVANMLGRMAPNVALGILIAALLHTLNIGIGMFSPTLHSLRLNYVEFLPKFYEPEGRMYRPFRKEALW
jgi:V/A-type H+-transporting ATPase subunit I